MERLMVVLLALFPVVSIFNMTLGNAFGGGLSVSGHSVFKGLGLPFPAVVFLGNVVGSIVLSWVIMPIVTRALSRWLNPFASRAETIRGVFILAACYAAELGATLFIFRTWGF